MGSGLFVKLGSSLGKKMSMVSVYLWEKLVYLKVDIFFGFYWFVYFKFFKEDYEVV